MQRVEDVDFFNTRPDYDIAAEVVPYIYTVDQDQDDEDEQREHHNALQQLTQYQKDVANMYDQKALEKLEAISTEGCVFFNDILKTMVFNSHISSEEEMKGLFPDLMEEIEKLDTD